VGYYEDASNRSHGFIYSGSTYTTLDAPGACAWCATIVNGINNNGQLVGEYSTASGATLGFEYSGGVYTTINDPLSQGAGWTVAQGINDNGEIVGYYYTAAGVYSGFTATPDSVATPEPRTAGLVLVAALSAFSLSALRSRSSGSSPECEQRRRP
jgi:probable HAF family extracellular repeat protein